MVDFERMKPFLPTLALTALFVASSLWPASAQEAVHPQLADLLKSVEQLEAAAKGKVATPKLYGEVRVSADFKSEAFLAYTDYAVR